MERGGGGASRHAHGRRRQLGGRPARGATVRGLRWKTAAAVDVASAPRWAHPPGAAPAPRRTGSPAADSSHVPSSSPLVKPSLRSSSPGRRGPASRDRTDAEGPPNRRVSRPPTAHAAAAATAERQYRSPSHSDAAAPLPVSPSPRTPPSARPPSYGRAGPPPPSLTRNTPPPTNPTVAPPPLPPHPPREGAFPTPPPPPPGPPPGTHPSESAMHTSTVHRLCTWCQSRPKLLSGRPPSQPTWPSASQSLRWRHPKTRTRTLD